MRPRPPARGRVRAGIALLAASGVVAVVLGLVGVGTSGSAAPLAVPGSRTPITVPATREPRPPPDTGTPASPPVHIDIPAIDVHSAVNRVGLNPDHTVQVPGPGPGYDQAAWYTGSAEPGRPGPAVVLGHIDSAANGPSVFYRLSQLEPLDEFTVTRADHLTLTYKVNSVRQYPKDAFPTEQVYGPTTRPEIRLITCGGRFDTDARSYEDNTVVYARQIAPRP